MFRKVSIGASWALLAITIPALAMGNIPVAAASAAMGALGLTSYRNQGQNSNIELDKPTPSPKDIKKYRVENPGTSILEAAQALQKNK